MNEIEQFRTENPPTNIESAALRRFNEEAMRELSLNRGSQRACAPDADGFLDCGPLAELETPSAPSPDNGFEWAD